MMREEGEHMSRKILRVVAFVVAVVGVWLLLASPALTEAAGQAILARHGGSMDTNLYLAQMQAATDSYRVIGGVLLGVGLFRGLQPYEG
jgi:UPF0716 family protein affecting phage T7 exclusion